MHCTPNTPGKAAASQPLLDPAPHLYVKSLIFSTGRVASPVSSLLFRLSSRLSTPAQVASSSIAGEYAAHVSPETPRLRPEHDSRPCPCLLLLLFKPSASQSSTFHRALRLWRQPRPTAEPLNNRWPIKTNQITAENNQVQFAHLGCGSRPGPPPAAGRTTAPRPLRHGNRSTTRGSRVRSGLGRICGTRQATRQPTCSEPAARAQATQTDFAAAGQAHQNTQACTRVRT